jgi:hypothetical protein
MPFRKPDHRVPLGKPAAQDNSSAWARTASAWMARAITASMSGPALAGPFREGVVSSQRSCACIAASGCCRRSPGGAGGAWPRPTPRTRSRRIRRFRGLALRAHQTRRQLSVDLNEAISPQHVGRGHVGHQTGDERAGFGLVAHHHPAHNRMIAAGIGMKRLDRNRIDDLVRHDAHAAQPRDGGMFVVVG